MTDLVDPCLYSNQIKFESAYYTVSGDDLCLIATGNVINSESISLKLRLKYRNNFGTSRQTENPDGMVTLDVTNECFLYGYAINNFYEYDVKGTTEDRPIVRPIGFLYIDTIRFCYINNVRFCISVDFSFNNRQFGCL